MNFEEGIISKHSTLTFACAVREQIELNYNVQVFFSIFSLLEIDACFSCGSPQSSKCRGNALNLNDCVLAMMDIQVVTVTLSLLSLFYTFPYLIFSSCSTALSMWPFPSFLSLIPRTCSHTKTS